MAGFHRLGCSISKLLTRTGTRTRTGAGAGAGVGAETVRRLGIGTPSQCFSYTNEWNKAIVGHICDGVSVSVSVSVSNTNIWNVPRHYLTTNASSNFSSNASSNVTTTIADNNNAAPENENMDDNMDDSTDNSENKNNKEEEETEHPPGWHLIHSPPIKGKYPKNSLVGTVVSTKMQKTVNVAVDRYRIVPKYRKRMRYTRKFMAHDETEDCHTGDLVLIVPGRKKSKRKHFWVHEIIRKKPML